VDVSGVLAAFGISMRGVSMAGASVLAVCEGLLSGAPQEESSRKKTAEANKHPHALMKYAILP
jgi:small neutral amino acid transporter SnatA (MarC family)